MNSASAIRLSIDSSQMVSLAYLDDMTDADFLHRPHPNCNHIAWQIGHLIVSEHRMIEGSVPGSMPEIPEGFSEKYTADTTGFDETSSFHGKQELLALFGRIHAATLAALTLLSDDDLDRPAAENIRSYAPTVGAAFSLQGTHWLMHAGQWAVIRRQIGRPPLF